MMKPRRSVSNGSHSSNDSLSTFGRGLGSRSGSKRPKAPRRNLFYKGKDSDDELEFPVDDENPRAALPGRRRNPNGKKKGRFVCLWIIMSVVGVTALCLWSYQERVVMKAQLGEHETMMHEQEINQSMQYDSKIQKMKEENSQLQQKLADEKELKIINQQLKDEKHRLELQVKDVNDQNFHLQNNKGNNDHSKQEVQHLEQQVHALENTKAYLSAYKTTMQENIKLMSKTALLEKFGPGPHHVEIEMRFDSHQGHADKGFITLELAPVDELPHAVYWFLEQVTRKLYDGCSFHRNAGHVIQGGPVHSFMTPPGTGNAELNQRFTDAGFGSLLFQEYSPNFPHHKYTLGYAGRPGGPEIYISTQDNSKIHGPGGQMNYEDPAEADTCFAKIVKGFELVDRMQNSPVKDGSFHSMKDNVAIVSMRKIKIQ